MAKKLTLKQANTGKAVTVTLPDEASLEDVLEAPDGMIRTLGYYFDGRVGIVE
jgi:hypothetical protein